jgi:hypothetical protein
MCVMPYTGMLLADNFVSHSSNPAAESGKGKEAMIKFQEFWFKLIPDITCTPAEMIVDVQSQRVVVRQYVTGIYFVHTFAFVSAFSIMFCALRKHKIVQMYTCTHISKHTAF